MESRQDADGTDDQNKHPRERLRRDGQRELLWFIVPGQVEHVSIIARYGVSATPGGRF